MSYSGYFVFKEGRTNTQYMNYIDITSTDEQLLQVNINIDGLGATTESISWVITQEGNDDSLDALTSLPDGSHHVTDHGYYQMLHLDLHGTSVVDNMSNETQYNIEGTLDGETVYSGKFVTTAQSLLDYSINDNRYTSNNSTNNYTILD